jgi:5-hydroxyisourate hydrolase-like protein (transthyretin family)
VVGAKVELIRAGDQVVATAETAADGTYTFTGVEANQPHRQAAQGRFPLRPGNGYVVRVSQKGYYPAASPAVDVRPEEQTLVADLTLAAVQGTAVVHVADPKGTPLEGAHLRLHPADGGEPVSGVTDGSGIGRLKAPITSTYWLEVEQAGYQKAMISPLVLAAGPETVVDVTVGAASGALYGQALDTHGRPAGGVVVVRTPDGRELSAAVQADGSYEVAGLPAGSPVLVSLRQGAETVAALNQVLTVPTGERVRADLALSQPTGSIQGRIVDEKGTPVSGVAVDLWRSGDGLVATAVTGADGSYRFENVRAGSYQRYAVRVDRAGQGYRQLGSQLPPALFLLPSGETEYVDLVLTALPAE